MDDTKLPRLPKDAAPRFTCEDFEKAKAEWLAENPGGDWDALRTQTKNRLAREQRYHREFADLSAAIIGFRK